MSETVFGQGRRSTRLGRSEVRDVVALGWDGFDRVGSALAVAYAILSIMRELAYSIPTECSSLPVSLLKRHMNRLIADSHVSDFRQLVDDNLISAEDLHFWARVLMRYVGFLPTLEGSYAYQGGPRQRNRR